MKKMINILNTGLLLLALSFGAPTSSNAEDAIGKYEFITKGMIARSSIAVLDADSSRVTNKEALENPLRAGMGEAAYDKPLDIPSNTLSIDIEAILLELEAPLTEEVYENDIPFNTLDVMLLKGIELEDEAEVDDLP
jgi:hypothetical protein